MSPRRYDVGGRTVLVTGAARGIGAAAAERLHGRGANVALVGLERERLEALASRLGERAAAFEADVTDTAALERAVAGTVERFGGVDVAIANAGVAFTGALASAPVEHVERTLMVNLFGVWRTNRAVLPALRERRGYLLNVASVAAISQQPLMGAYAASKAGTEALTNSLRAEMAPAGVAVGCAYFGFIDTDLVRGGFAHGSSQALRGLLPGFAGRPAPLRVAIDAIERGVERRSARVWAPRFVGGLLALRGVLQPLMERRAQGSPELAQALALAERSEELAAQDPVLGVAGPAASDPSR